MNTENPGKKYIWLFLVGMSGQALGSSLIALQGNRLDLLGGFLVGLSCVALGAYIYLAVAKPRGGSAL